MTKQQAAVGSHFSTHYDEVGQFRPDAFSATPVGRGDHLQAVVVCFEAGQFIPVHAPSLDLALVVLEGEGELALEDRTVVLTQGSVAFVPAGCTRGIRASTRLKAFQVVGPPPTPADHQGVRAGLQRRSWR
ncbi:MAG TPA: cupin domain-containing protein [Trueperaceae bacterium]